MEVQGVAHLARLETFDQVEMRHLPQGMDTGIGAARARDGDAFARQLFDGGFQRRLHRGPLGLTLPAHKGAAVIFEGEAIARHQTSCVPRGTAKPLSRSAAAIALPPAR